MSRISKFAFYVTVFLTLTWLPTHSRAQISAGKNVVKKCLIDVSKDIVYQTTADCYLHYGEQVIPQLANGEPLTIPETGLTDNPNPFGVEVPKICEFTPVLAEAIDLAYCAEAVITRVDTIILEHQNEVRSEELRKQAAEIAPGYHRDAYEACGEWMIAHYNTYRTLWVRFVRAQTEEEQRAILAEIRSFLEFVRQLARNTGINNCDQSRWGTTMQGVINKCFFDNPDYSTIDFKCLE